MSQSTNSPSLLSPPDLETTTANVLAPPPAPDDAPPRKRRRSQGLPPLSTAGVDVAHSGRLVSLEERLATQEQNTARLTPGGTMRTAFDVPLSDDKTALRHPREVAPGMTRESAAGSEVAAGKTRESPAGSQGIPHTIGVAVDMERAFDDQFDD